MPRNLLRMIWVAGVLTGVGSAPAENVALHKEVVGFSSPSIMHVPFAFGAQTPRAKAVDGDPKTVAANAQAFPWVVEVRLGDAYPVDRVVLVQPAGGASKEYAVRVAGNGYDWQTIAEVKPGKAGRQEFKFDVRWVSRVRIDSRTPKVLGSSDGNFTPAEIEVYRSDRKPAGAKPALLAPLADAPPETYRPRYPLGDEKEDLDCRAPEWLLKTFRRAHVDVKLLEEAQRRETIDRAAAAGMKLFCIPVWGQEFTWFPSRLAAMNPKLEGLGDPFREVVDRVHAKGMKFGCYNCPVTSPRVYEHPRWIMRNLGGELQVNAGWYEGCWNSPYTDHFIDRLIEAARAYPIDVFWLDGFWVHEGCACDYCKVKFKRETGRAFPATYDWKDPNFLAWREWRGRQSAEALRRVRRALLAVRPDLTIITNTYSSQSFPLTYPWSSTYESQFMPSVSEEHGLSFIEDMTFHHFMANYVRSVAGDNRDAELWLYQGVNGNIPLVDFRLRTLTQIAAGAKPEFCAECGSWARLKTVYDDIAAREPWLGGTKRVKWAALLVSDRMKNFDAARRTAGGWPSLDDIGYMWSYERGLYRAMVEEHLPVTMVRDADLETGRLEGYQVLLVGNATSLSDRANAAIRKFVADGGGLVVTHDTSGRNGWGEERRDFGLAELLGCHRKGASTAEGQVRIAAASPAWVKAGLAEYIYHSMTPGDASQWLPWKGPLVQVEAGRSQKVYLSLETSQGTWPFLVMSQEGKGRIAYFPAGIDYTLFRSSTPWAARLITGAVRSVAQGRPCVEGTAPAIVSLTAFDQPAQKRLVVHLLNDYSSQGRVPTGGSWTRRDYATLADLAVTVRGKEFTRTTLEPGHQALKMEKHGSDYVITVPKLDLHRMVVVEYTSQTGR